MDRISAYVYDESNVYNEAWARRLDIELNIRDNQATALEVAMYVRGEFAEDKQQLTDAQVTAAGIAREGKIGSIGYRIGRHACESVMDALRNKVIEDTDALAIADFCPGNESVQGKGLKVILDGGSKTEARARMEAELAKQKMAREVGVEGGTDLFGNALEDEAFWDFVAKYVVGRRNELAKDALFLRTNVGKRNSSAMTKKYGVDLKDPESLKKALKEIDMLRERWKNPYGEADLMEEIKQAWQERQEGEGKPAAQVFERYAQRLRERESGVTDYSAREEEKRYRVENDTTGLAKYLNDRVKPIEINFTPKNAPDSGKSWLDDFKEFYSKALAGKELVIRRTGNKLYFHNSRDAVNVASKGARSQKRNETGKKMEEVVVEAYHLYHGTPEHRENEGNHRKKMVNASDEFHVFGHPATVNGEKMMVCFTAIHRKDETDPKRLRFYEFGTPKIMQKKDGEPNVKDRLSYHPATPSEDTLADYLKNVNSDFEGKPKIVEEAAGTGDRLTVAQAQERGMFKDGVMEVSNGVIVAPDTDYSVDFSHASYALFRKPDKKHVGKGEGVQVFGWACIYGAESWDTNKFYHGQFTQKVRGGFSLNGKVVSERAVLKQLNKETGKEYLLKFLNGAFRSNADEYRQLIEENRGWIEEDKERLAEAERGYIDGKKRSEAEIKEEKAHLENAIKNRTSKLEAYEWLAKNEVHKVEDSVRYPVNYLMRADVDDSNLLHWDVPEFVGRELDSPDIGGAYYGREMVEKILELDMKEPTEDLVRALWNMMQKPEVPEEGYVAFKESVNIEPIEYEFSSKEFDAADYDMETLLYWGEYIANVCMTGKEVYNALAHSLGSPRAASEWLDEHGVRGVKYYDGNTRHKEGEKVHNYAIFNPDYIEVIAINNRHPWSEYSEDNPDWQRPEEVFGGSPVTDYSVAGMRARTAGANMDRVYRDPADGKEKFVIPTANARLSTGFTLGQLKAPVGGHKDVTLGAVLEYPELYEAYPELKGMRVRLYNPRLQEGVGGFFARPRGEKAGYLALNTGVEVTPERVMETLLHESQHAIQAIEGHAMGAGSMNAEEALEYLDRAIAARKGIMKAAGDDAWSRENLAYLEAMRGMVQGKEGRKMQEMAISQVYWYSHGEQEARFTGAGKDGDPMAEGSGLTENSPTTYTIAVPGEATELGGVTFGGMGRFSYLLESRLGTAGEFNYDRAVYQMKEAVVRRMKELRMLGDSKDERARGVQLAAEALATMESLESLLPATYRFGLEAYKVYFSSYAKLAGSGSAAAAGRMVPMAGWGERMRGAYEKMAWMAVEGHFYKGDMEFWGEHWKKVEKILPPLQEKWEELQKMYVGGLLRGKARQDAINAAWRELRHELPEEMRTLMQAVGEVRADKLMAKFMERVALQLDAFRKDKTLGRIRRVVGALKPGAKENGKPVKGRMDAERYRKVVDMVRLMELTRGEKELFERERYTGEGTEKAWADLEPNDTVTVRTYDGEGKEVEIACSKEEFETYACFETMTASQAEAASRALGEYISTGRQAWDNAQEAARKRIEALCAPALEKYGETENELKARRERQQRKAMPLVNKTLNFLGFGLNDAQFFDVCSKVPEIEKWTKDAVYRIASAHTYIEAKERDRQEFMTQAAREASGEKDDKKVREWLDDTRRNRDTGIKLAPQEPDFDAQETETVRRQFMGLLRRKTHKKNFNPNTFAEALRYLTEEDGLMPEAVAREALDKYGTLGDAKASRLHGKEALMVLLTDNEYARFSDLTMTAKKRAEAAREKWQKEREEEETKRKEEGKPKEKENGTLVLSPAQAAYRVLLWEQADYTDNLIMQGYTPEVVQRLREFAGEKVMRMAYALREKMGERTEEIRDMYERVYGMPFPEVENYFRAFFDVAYETRQEGIMSGEGAGYAAGAGTMKILYHRNHRNARIDPTMTMYEAFNAGMKEQDLLLGYGELPSELLRILNYKEGHQTMSDALEKCLGSGALSEMRQHVENMSRLVPEVERYARAATRLISEWSSAGAQMILSWRQGSLVKQLTAFFNGVAGSEYVGVLDYFTSLGKVMLGLGRIRLKDLAERPELKGRFKGWENAENMKAMMSPADVRTAMPGAAVFAGKGMAAMEWLDVWANVRQAAAVYDAAYRKLRLKVPDATPEELDGLAMREVQHALALKSQPLDWRQRSLGSLKKSPFTIGSFFLGGESVNTFANFARLLAKHEYLDAAAVWLSHGFGLQALTALYNFITDDKEQWEKRSLGGYFRNALLGPLGGIPLLSTAYNEWVWEPFHRKAKWLPYVQTTDLIPAADLERLYREWRKANKSGEWEAYTLACDDTLRVVATGALLASRNSTGKAGLWAKAGAVIVGGVGNLVDFFVRVERAAKERWELWD